MSSAAPLRTCAGGQKAAGSAPPRRPRPGRAAPGPAGAPGRGPARAARVRRGGSGAPGGGGGTGSGRVKAGGLKARPGPRGCPARPERSRGHGPRRAEAAGGLGLPAGPRAGRGELAPGAAARSSALPARTAPPAEPRTAAGRPCLRHRSSGSARPGLSPNPRTERGGPAAQQLLARTNQQSCAKLRRLAALPQVQPCAAGPALCSALGQAGMEEPGEEQVKCWVSDENWSLSALPAQRVALRKGTC